MSEMERRKADKEIEAAQDRLKHFVKKASECKGHHDPERLARYRDGRPNAPHGVIWAELGRKWRMM